MYMDSQEITDRQSAPGAPAWVTPNLLADTIATWQPYYSKRLTNNDSLEIILGIARLFDAVHHQNFSEN